MAKKPHNFQWLGFTDEQIKLLDLIDHVGNNGWARNSQTEEMLPNVLAHCAKEGLTIDQVVSAMESIGYDRRTTHQLVRWDRKRRTGKFGK
ncbi:hypothetical protein [Nesterenkonia suensis]